jgi:hypothetical protein
MRAKRVTVVAVGIAVAYLVVIPIAAVAAVELRGGLVR